MKSRIGILFLLAVIMTFGTQLAVAKIGEEVSGGGQILDTDGLKVSFGVYALDKGSDGYDGEVQINFHNVGDDAFDKSKFHGEVVTDIVFWPSDNASCNAAVTLYVDGSWEGMPGYSVILRAADFDAPGHWTGEAFDTVRVELFDGSTEIYDTHDGDFEDQSNCVGTARTKLDRGNLSIEVN